MRGFVTLLFTLLCGCDCRERGGVPPLLDAEDMMLMGRKPDYKCVFTYLTEVTLEARQFDSACDTDSFAGLSSLERQRLSVS